MSTLETVFFWVGGWGAVGGAFLLLGNRHGLDAVQTGALFVYDAVDRADTLLFGEKIFSGRAFLVSCLITALLSVPFLGYLFAGLFVDVDLPVQLIGTYYFPRNGLLNAAGFVSPIVLNLVLDFTSVCVTRAVLKQLKHGRALKFISLDASLSLLIAFVSGYSTMVLTHAAFLWLDGYPFSEAAYAIQDANVFVLGELLFFEPEPAPNEFEYVAYLFWFPFAISLATSIWLWLYLVGWTAASILTSSWANHVFSENIMAPVAFGCGLFGFFSLPLALWLL